MRKKRWNRYAAGCMVSRLVMSQVTGCAKNEAVRVTAQLGEGVEKTVEGTGAHTEGNIIIIEEAGTYVFSGALADGQIRIEAGENELVHLVLNGVTLSNETTAPIYSPEKCKVVLTLEAGTTNVISDGSQYIYESEGEDGPDSPIFTNGSLTINGTGRLEVTGNYQSGIRSKDTLKIISGVIIVNSQDNGINSAATVATGQEKKQDQDGVYTRIAGGELWLNARADGRQQQTRGQNAVIRRTCYL